MENTTHSKLLKKTDDASKKLIIEVLENNHTGGFDIDCVYKIRNQFIIIEFLKCDTVRPFNSHPNRYWYKNSRKFKSLWEFNKKISGKLILVNYEDSREQFKIIEVESLGNNGINKEKIKKLNFNDFKSWFIKINNQALDG